MLAFSPSQRRCLIPDGLMSLRDMLEFRANEFIWAIRAFHAVEVLVDQKIAGSTEIIDDGGVADILERLQELEQACDQMGAVITVEFVRDAKRDLESGKMTWDKVAASSKQINAVLQKEIARAKLFAMSPSKISYFADAQNLFEFDVGLSFPQARDDIDEAGKCFAFGRFTACVFHLMRVLEHPISALALVLLPDDPSPNWETVFKKIDAELARKPSDRAIKGDVQFYAEVVAEMRAVKHAWRNRVMHIDAIVTEERAKAIFDATISFMNVVSKRLSEAGEIPPETGELEL